MDSLILSKMTTEEAHLWKSRVGGTANQLRMLLFEGYEREAWDALGYGNWTECVKALAEEYGFTERRLWQLHAANQSEKLLNNCSVGEISESVLRPLTSLPTEHQPAVWQKSVETAPNGRPTAAHVEATVRSMYPSSKAAELPPNATRLTLAPPIAPSFLSPKPASAYVSPVAPVSGGEVVRSEVRYAPAPPIRDDEFDDMEDTEEDIEDMNASATHRVGHDWTVVSGPDGSYRQNGDTKFCEKCKSLWAADLPYCPYCNISPEARTYEGQQQKDRLRLAAANHAVSDDPDYDGDEWYTPAEIIESARLVMGSIDLDPATCEEAQQVVKADKYYTKDDDSLRDAICWYGNVWLNPPYSAKLIIQFIEKLIAEYDNGNITQAVVITNNSSETDWFQNLLERFPTCFKRRRAKFWRPNADDFGARQGQAIFYLGDNVDGFCDEFSKMGVVVIKHDNQ